MFYRGLFLLLLVTMCAARIPDGPPKLLYSTYLGGEGNDSIEAIAIDGTGNIYLTGLTSSSDFPVTPNAVQKQLAGKLDLFVLKLNPAGNTILYSTYLGGTGSDVARGIAVDGAGNIYVAGDTTSTDFPVKNAAQPVYGGGVSDGFAFKLKADGSALDYSTYAGGNGEEYLYKIVIDVSGNAYLCGSTDAQNYPTRNALYPNYRGGLADGFVTKVDPAGSTFLYSTFLGGSQTDAVAALAVDGEGNLFAAGATNSLDFPVLNAYQSTRRDSYDGFIAKLNASGQALVFSTYLGGSGSEACADLAINAAGQAFVTGSTSSRDFPLASPAQAKFGGGNYDAFAAKLGHQGNSLLYSTYLGGDGLADKGDDEAFAITVDALGNAYIAGVTYSQSFPTTDSTKSLTPDRDAFVVKLIPAGVPIGYSTYLGGNGMDLSRDIAVDALGNAYVAGSTVSPDFPTLNALQATRANASDGFLTKLAAVERGGVTTVSAASYAPTSVAPESIVSAFGTGMADVTLSGGSSPLPTILAGTTISVNGAPVPLFYISPDQINYLIPASVGTGTASVTLYNDGAIIGAGAIQIAMVSPGIFTMDATGKGLPAAQIFRLKADRTQSWQPVAGIDPKTGLPFAIPIDLGPESDQVFLVLYGTGARYRSALSSVQASMGGLDAQVLYCGAQNDYVGLDQINLRIPRDLRGRGDVNVILNVDGKQANAVVVNIGN